MPAPVEEAIATPTQTTALVRMEPVHNQIHSLLLLSQVEDLSGLGDWIYRTHDALPDELQQRHRLVMHGFYYILMPERSFSDFPSFLNHLASADPSALRDRLLERYASVEPKLGAPVDPESGRTATVDFAAVLRNADSYLEFLQERYPDCFDPDLESEAFGFIIDPPAMQSLIVSHLKDMWDRYLSAEWERCRRLLSDSVEAFRQSDLSGKNLREAAQFITGQTLEDEKWNKVLSKADRVVFVPNPHLGPYLGKAWAGDSLLIFFGARLPTGTSLRAPELSRAEIVVRIGALADDYRLQILRLVSEHGELRSQEIMDRLKLSQSAASRHLRQLSANGYLSERRCEGAKCYQLNLGRIEESLDSVVTYLTNG